MGQSASKRKRRAPSPVESETSDNERPPSSQSFCQSLRQGLVTGVNRLREILSPGPPRKRFRSSEAGDVSEIEAGEGNALV